MEYVIETKELTKKYGSKAACDKVSIHVKKGDIYGLIGKNGAGKTTLMKCILGMARPKDGQILINGESKNLKDERKKIGSLIEAPGIYDGCSAYENLLRFSILYGAPKERIPELLALVGLADVGGKKAGHFSLGMKQRLGIAIAMLNDPEILVLDEPVNGLDPEGIRDVRDLMLRLNSEKGVTILISSHLIDELSKVVNVYGIMNNGVLKEEVTAAEIKSQMKSYVSLKSSDNEKACALITESFECEARVINDEVRVIGINLETNKIGELLMNNQIYMTEIKLNTRGFEDYFIERLGD